MTLMEEKTSRFDLPVTASAIVLPTIVTVIYFVVLAKSPAAIQQAAYAIGKGIQFGLPIVFMWLFHRWRLRQPPEKRTNAVDWLIGFAFGLLVVASMFAAWFLFLSGTEIGNSVTAAVVEKVSGLKLNTPLKFLALGVFYALGHSLLEEYYWRWFVFERLTKMTSKWNANVISSVGFAAHHVILLATFFGWSSPLTWLFSAGVAVGGIAWAWLYDRSGSLLVPWISHLIVDAGIFALGYLIGFA